MRVITLDAHVGGAAVRLATSGLPRVDGGSIAERSVQFERVAGDLAGDGHLLLSAKT